MPGEIILSPSQKQVYDAIRKVTDGGAETWTGTLSVPGLPRTTINAAIKTLEAVRAINAPRAEPKGSRTFAVLARPEAITVGSPSEVMQARDRYWHTFVDRDVKLDDGRFMAKLAEVQRSAAR